MEDNKLHWFCLSFIGGDARTGRSCNANTYMGYDNVRVTKRRIDAAKEAAGVQSDAVLISCSYLGRMTRNDFEGQ